MRIAFHILLPILLAYNDENLPEDGNLNVEDYQRFFKRLRHKFPLGFRYMLVGEYGEDRGRPHYHCALFGVGMAYNKILAETWGKGDIHVGEVNAASCRYLVAYIGKGMYRKHEKGLEGRAAEFMRSSKGYPGGMGAGTIDRIAKKERVRRIDKDFYITEFQIGRMKYPLGSYLAKRLHRKRGGNESAIELNYDDYQRSILDANLLDGSDFRFNLLVEDEVKRRKLYAKKRFFKKRKGF